MEPIKQWVIYDDTLDEKKTKWFFVWKGDPLHTDFTLTKQPTKATVIIDKSTLDKVLQDNQDSQYLELPDIDMEKVLALDFQYFLKSVLPSKTNVDWVLYSAFSSSIYSYKLILKAKGFPQRNTFGRIEIFMKADKSLMWDVSLSYYNNGSKLVKVMDESNVPMEKLSATIFIQMGKKFVQQVSSVLPQ